ncbi:LacI family DNA-binding transcriptional regulator [Paenibacillus sp. OAS669]|uniref:LacI family DNA-binding transcriptional regulator n=1 Tax=Paenibacillus sp. OAS669 TaxID=2663821 RepID=UPI00178AE994|nr:LacI family DNA-binding transcriptional regulator [Paenibacillus sp. OAS669]MBE1442995.1 LacI family transcriptional regulator [Paenibacillus sp. OAS669]
MKIRLKDIALRTGFSINTVSRALQNKEDIAKETRQIILATARELGYIPNGLASGLRSGLTRTIAVILSDVANPFFAIMTRFIEIAARKNNYAVFVLNSGEEQELEEQAIGIAMNKGVDGIILFPVQESARSIELLRQAKIPYVLVGRHIDHEDTDFLITDDINGGYLATEHLIQAGARRILLLNGPGHMSCAREREEGYRKALKAYGIGYNSGLVIQHEITHGNTYALMKQILANRFEFTGIFAFSDVVAWEAIYALQEAGIRVPEQMKVVGYDNIQSQLYYPFPLTTIHISKDRMAFRAVEIMMKKIKGEAELECYQEIFETTLVVRSSC